MALYNLNYQPNKNQLQSINKQIDQLEYIMGLCQHHDLVTGTSRNYLILEYQ